MPENELTRSRRVLNWIGKRLPFFWISVTPVVTVPLSALLLFTVGGEHEAEALGLPAGDLCKFDGMIAQTCFYYFDYWRTWLLLALPGVVNLLVLLWFLNRNGYVRVAATAALVLGLARSLVIPLATLAVAQFDVIDDGGLWLRVEIAARGMVTDIDPPTVNLAVRQLLFTVWIAGAVMWVLTVALWRAYEPLMARYWRNLDPPGGPRPDQPPRWTGFLSRR